MIKLILFITILVLVSCADEFSDRLNRAPAWVQSIETLPRVEGFQQAGIFDLNDTFIAQFCDSHGNQRWMKYDNETNKWSSVKYVTLGCVDGNRAESIE